MNFINRTRWFRQITIGVSCLIVSLILLNTYVFFQRFKYEERAKMEIFASAIKEFESNTDLNASFNLETTVFENIKGIPLILTDSEGQIIESHNLDPIKSQDKSYLESQLSLMKIQNDPIEINYFKNKKQFVYYRNSDLLNKLTYYPLALLLILFLFLSVVVLFSNSSKVAEQNKLWTGMAKETAHQIGTPLSSLLGWITILRSEDVNEEYISEIERDVERLNVIANRFSKIGSTPVLKEDDIVKICKKTFDYLQSRSSKRIQFIFSASHNEIIIKHNKELIGWVIENLIKNAIDAMQGKGRIELTIKKNEEQGATILISDSGKGIPKSKHQQIFKPGFTTKKRGWGLGLSLSKRIINNYHKGKIFVQKSEIGKGTVFEIQLR